MPLLESARKITDNVDEAVHEVRHFYSNFHSVRYTRDDIVIRLHRKPTPQQLQEISAKFSDIKLLREEAAVVADKADEIKAQYVKYFKV